MAKKPYESRPQSKMSILSGRGHHTNASNMSVLGPTKVKLGSRNEQNLKPLKICNTQQNLLVDSDFLDFYGKRLDVDELMMHERQGVSPNLAQGRTAEKM